MLPLAALALLLIFANACRLENRATIPAELIFAPWNTISADPYQTQFFALRCWRLTLSGLLLARYASSEKRCEL